MVDFLMGGVSAAVSETAAAPIERVKLLIQNQDEMIKAGRPTEPIIRELLIVLPERPRMKAFWLFGGATLPMLSDTSSPGQALNFAFKDYFKILMLVLHLSYLCLPWIMLEHVLANDAMAGTKGGERQFNGLIDVYKKTLKADGVAGLYRGFNISVPWALLGMYDSLNPVVLVGQLQDRFLASFLLGWGVTTGAGLASYPIDTVPRRMMMTPGEAVKYQSSLDAFKQIIKNEGIKSLFKEAGASILRAVGGAGVLAGYDKLQLIVFGKKYGSGGGGGG